MSSEIDLLAAAAAKYEAFSENFGEFLKALRELNRSWFSPETDGNADNTSLRFTSLGKRYLVRRGVCVDQNGEVVNVVECLKANDRDGEFSPFSKCFLIAAWQNDF